MFGVDSTELLVVAVFALLFIGPQDLRNPAAPRIVYGPDNWFRSHEDIDDPGD